MSLDPSEARRIDVADVYKGDVLAGKLERTTGGVTFTYDGAYLGADGPPVATTLPRRHEPHFAAGGAVPAFFAGLLPEGARLLAVISATKTSPSDEFSLLLAIGDDTVGDVTVVPVGEKPRSLTPPPSDADTASVSFRELFLRSVDPEAKQLDRAVAGAQDKLSDAVISFPVAGDAGPALLKLSPDRYPRLVENEAFFLTMAKACGFEVPRFRIVEDRDGQTGLLIERFDRTVETGRVVRLAQEDACQLLGLWPADKYRVSMRDVIDAVRNVASAPLPAALQLVLATAFSYLVVNGDMHAKNVSVRWLPDERLVALTPLYDLVSTRPYPVDDRLALLVDGRDDRIRGRDLVRFADRFGVAERLVRRRLDDLCERAEPFLTQLATIGFDDRTTSQMRDTMGQRLSELRS